MNIDKGKIRTRQTEDGRWRLDLGGLWSVGYGSLTAAAKAAQRMGYTRISGKGLGRHGTPIKDVIGGQS